MRVCIVYDCLYPHTVGGAERWYRNLSEQLAAEGHDVTYLTLRQWQADEAPDVRGVRVLAVGPRMQLYVHGRRRIGPPLIFGLGVLRHLLRHGRGYDVVHTASFPYFSLLGAAAVRPIHRFRLVVDWHEVWTREYWGEYLGPLGGRIGWVVQRLCLRLPQRAFCFSRLHERRLRGGGVRGEVVVLEGQFEGSPAEVAQAAEPVVVFAGRHIPEKRVPALVPAIARARQTIPELRGVIYGDGPERYRVLELIRTCGLEGIVEAPGFVEGNNVERAFDRAMCLVLPSRREGYGLAVLEALARGTPAVVARADDNAAAEFIVEGENGFVAPSASASDLADAIGRVHEAGTPLRASTLAWFRSNAARLSLARSLHVVLETYGSNAPTASERTGLQSPRRPRKVTLASRPSTPFRHDSRHRVIGVQATGLRDLWAHSRIRVRRRRAQPALAFEQNASQIAVTCVVFSKDRAMQLDACLSSIERFAPYTGDIVVIYKATNDRFADAYRTLARRDRVQLVPQSDDFRLDVIETLGRAATYSVFHTDDDVFFREAPAAPEPLPGVAAFSLRLGTNATYCYPSARQQRVPPVTARDEVVAWDWTRADGDFAYPMSLNGHVFSTSMLRRILARAHFTNPNELEVELHVRRHLVPTWMLSFRKSCVVSIPANIVGSFHGNRASRDPGLSPEALNDRFLAGERIDFEAMDFSSVRAAHQEVALLFRAGGGA